MAPRELLTVTLTSGYGASCIFYTDGSLIEGCAGFSVHQMGVGGFGHKSLSPAGVSTAELSALFTGLRHIAEVIQPPERCLIPTDSLSSVKAMLSRKIAHQTHPLVYECKLSLKPLFESKFKYLSLLRKKTLLSKTFISV
jgi:hypothetical protein